MQPLISIQSTHYYFESLLLEGPTTLKETKDKIMTRKSKTCFAGGE